MQKEGCERDKRKIVICLDSQEKGCGEKRTVGNGNGQIARCNQQNNPCVCIPPMCRSQTCAHVDVCVRTLFVCQQRPPLNNANEQCSVLVVVWRPHFPTKDTLTPMHACGAIAPTGARQTCARMYLFLYSPDAGPWITPRWWFPEKSPTPDGPVAVPSRPAVPARFRAVSSPTYTPAGAETVCRRLPREPERWRCRSSICLFCWQRRTNLWSTECLIC